MIDIISASAAIMMSGSSSASSQSLFDRIAALPAVYSFDIADGWRCEICKDDFGRKSIGHRYDYWDDAHPYSVCDSESIYYYTRIYHSDKLMCIMKSGPYEYTSRWYASSDGINADELKKETISYFSELHFLSVSEWSGSSVPTVKLNCMHTTIIDGTETTAEKSITVSFTNDYICNDEFDLSNYGQFAQTLRDFSDELNKTE